MALQIFSVYSTKFELRQLQPRYQKTTRAVRLFETRPGVVLACIICEASHFSVVAKMKLGP